VFGDSIAPRGGSIWLGSLIEALAPFGISERLVRTSVYRLAQDGWLQSTKVGRRSYYGLTDEGRARFEAATRKIYGEPVTEWGHTWHVILLSGLDTATRDLVRKELGWLGFGTLSPSVLAHPVPNRADLDTTLGRLGVADAVVVLSARTIRNEAAMRGLVQASWNLADIDRRYAEFVARFRPLIAARGKSTTISARTAFLVRTLLIQEYRKVLLRDPQLPAELLPADWRGTAACQLCRNLYLAVYRPADEYLSGIMQTAEGPLPPPAAAYFTRFGGLEETQ
jgi:phenylacetic acid degradation operon negative regulatory protein